MSEQRKIDVAEAKEPDELIEQELAEEEPDELTEEEDKFIKERRKVSDAHASFQANMKEKYPRAGVKISPLDWHRNIGNTLREQELEATRQRQAAQWAAAKGPGNTLDELGIFADQMQDLASDATGSERADYETLHDFAIRLSVARTKAEIAIILDELNGVHSQGNKSSGSFAGFKRTLRNFFYRGGSKKKRSSRKRRNTKKTARRGKKRNTKRRKH